VRLCRKCRRTAPSFARTRARRDVIPINRNRRKTRRASGVELISDTLPFGGLWYDTPDNAIGYAIHSSRSHSAVIHVYDAAGNIVETHEHKGDFKEWLS